VEAMRPAIAVVSVGRANHFGHPAPAVVERYREVGAELFRTDRDGAIMVESDGYSVDVQTFAGRGMRVTPDGPRNHEGTSHAKAPDHESAVR
jgi:beta-lactamase superfamily II metal-dependent hydrolase